MLNFVSLFSGGGGFDLGFIKNGFNCLGAFDNDKIAIENYKNNIGDWIVNMDLMYSSPDKIWRGEKKVNVVISGSPCQGYSTIGKRDVDDPRNSLLVKGGEIAIALKTDFFIAENVVGSLYGEHKKYWSNLVEILSNNGYDSKIEIINSVQYGIAQTRKRVFLFAWKKGQDFVLQQIDKPRKNLIDVISNINGLPNNQYELIEETDARMAIVKSIKQGQKLCDVRGGNRAIHSWQIPEFFGSCNSDEIDLLNFIKVMRRKLRRRASGDADPVSIEVLHREFGGKTDQLVSSLVAKSYLIEKEPQHFDLKRSFNGKYRRLSWDQPSLTVDTRFGKPDYFLHPEENRGLSIREIARIQGFEDSYTFYGNQTQQLQLIGNAIPPPISFEIARMVKEFFIARDGE